MRHLRSSRLPLHALCPASVGDASSIRISGGGAAADLGTALHFVQAARINSEPVDLAHVAAEYDVDADELQRLAAWAWKGWLDLRQWFPDPQTEVELEGRDHEHDFHLTGHADVLSQGFEGTLAICDWKSGWLDGNWTAQLRAYGLLALLKYPEAERVYLVACRLRTQEYTAELLTRDQINAWWNQFASRLNEGGYNAGRWCGHCPVSLGCPAKINYLTEASEWIPAGAEGRWSLGELHDRAAVLQQSIERFKELERAEVRKAGGRLDLGDGRELVLTEQPRRSIDFTAGWPVIQEVLPDADLAGAVTISKSKVEAAAKQFAARGRKGRAVQELMDRLDVAGAMRTTIIERLEIRRTNDGNDSSDTGGVKAITSGAAAGSAGERPDRAAAGEDAE